MSLHFDITKDDPTLLNYLALYISIKGYPDEKTGKKVFPTAKESLLLMGVPTNEENGRKMDTRGKKY